MKVERRGALLSASSIVTLVSLSMVFGLRKISKKSQMLKSVTKVNLHSAFS